MKIPKTQNINTLFTTNLDLKNKIAYKPNFSSKPDVVSFSSRHITDTQLYRCINADEFKKLLNLEKISGPFYATSDKRGWQAKSWVNGYMANIKNHFFVKFKKGSIDYTDARNFTNDTRYKIFEYNLDNVQEIREGHSMHGKLVYSENFDADKAKDLVEKKQSIKDSINNIKQNKNVAESFDILQSYSEEFPKLKNFIAKKRQAELNPA